MEHKVVTEIDCPKDWEAEENDYFSHRPALWLSLSNTDGEVLEVGCGFGSTRLLEEYCSLHNREFKSYENDEEWASKFKLSYGVQIVFKDGYPILTLPLKEDLVFIDSKPGEQRKDLIKAFSETANVIVVHDTEVGTQSIYGIVEVLNSFKYRLDYYPAGSPGTTILSNKIDVTKWV